MKEGDIKNSYIQQADYLLEMSSEAHNNGKKYDWPFDYLNAD